MPLILPPGITGFGAEAAPFTPASSVKPFRTLCFALTRQLYGRVVTFESCGGCVTPSFHWAELELRSGVVFLLCNAYYPWLAVTAQKPDRTGHPFSPAPEIEQVAAGFPPFRLLSPIELEVPLSRDALLHLQASELIQLLYWKPERLGDVIFNYWG